MGQERRSVYVSTPSVIDVGYPINHTNSFTMDIDLKTIPVVKLEVILMNPDTALSNGKNPVGHLEFYHFSPGKAFVSDLRVDVIPVANEAGK